MSGNVLGIPVGDLSDPQLMKLNFSNLVSLLGDDTRIPKLVVSRMNEGSLTEDNGIREVVSITAINNFPEIIEAYNNYYEKHLIDIGNCHYSYYGKPNKTYSVKWSLLSDKNRAVEVRRYTDGLSSAFNYGNVDYKWLNKYDSGLCAATVEKIILAGNISSFGRMVPHMSKADINGICDKHFSSRKQRDGQNQMAMQTIGNEGLSDKYTVLALKEISKYDNNLPDINVDITLAHLKELAPIMRMKLLEQLLYGYKYF